jgi:hypothetical protein
MSSDAFITGIDLGGRTSQGSVASSFSSVSSVSSAETRSTPAQSSTPYGTFDPTKFDLEAIYDPTSLTDPPPTVHLHKCIAEAEPLYGDTKDELLKHSWTKCFVENAEVLNMSKDLFWWALYKIMESNRATKEPEDLPPTSSSPGSSRMSTPHSKRRKRTAGSSRAEGEGHRRRYFDADGGIALDEEDMYDDDNLDSENDDSHWLASLNRDERRKELEEAVKMGTLLPSINQRQTTEDKLLDRVAATYLHLFRKTCFNIEYFVNSDDPTNDFDDGLLPDPMEREPINSIRAMSFHARHVCDKVVGAFPDAFAQIIVSSLQRAAPRVVDDFGHDRLKECCSDVMNVMINGMRQSKTNVGHWPARQSPMMRARQQSTMNTRATKGAKKKMNLAKELTMLSRTLDKKVHGDHHSHTHAHSHSHHHSKTHIHSGGSGSGSGSGGNETTAATSVEGDPSMINSGASTESPRNSTLMSKKKKKNNATITKDILTRLEEDDSESTLLEAMHVVTKTKFVLGHSHFIGKLVEQNNMSSTMRKRELTITLTTSNQRPDLVPGTSKKGDQERGESTSASERRQRTDVFGWVAKESIGQRGGEDGERRREEMKEFNKKFVPMTVRSALNDSKARIEKILEKNRIAKRQSGRAVREIRARLGIDLQGIAKNARRAKSGDVNELANELSGLNAGKKKKKKR